MKKLLFIAIAIASTQVQAQDLEMTARLKATCYGYLHAHRDQQPDAFARAEKLAHADTYAGKYITTQVNLFKSSKAEVFKPMAVDNCRKLNIQAK